MDDLQNIKYESPWIDLIISFTDFVPLANRSIKHSEGEENTSKHVAVITIYTLKDISASQERLCHLLSKNYKSACAIYWENIILHSHPETEISFKFIPKILMSKECIHFFGPLCIYIYIHC